MELRNCTSCGRTFAYSGSEICSRCGNTDEEDFQKVKEYLYDHPGATIVEVSEETEVSEKKILRYLRESRIEIREEDNMMLDCERCGASIRSGRFCDKCSGELKRELTSVLKPKEKPLEKPKANKTGTKMHIAGMRKKDK
ncbi:MAG: MerR family transcriptional regulator [Clostridiaceae bacterium]|nr:MerR family transcriptional regulator [Clostridiaceae bacterium]